MAFEVARLLPELGHQVTVLATRPGTDRAFVLPPAVRLVSVRARNFAGLMRAQVSVASTLPPAMVRAIRRVRPDVVWSHSLQFQTTHVAAWAAQRAHVPFVVTVHIGDLEALGGAVGVAARAHEATLGRWILRVSRSRYRGERRRADHVHSLAPTSPSTLSQTAWITRASGRSRPSTTASGSGSWAAWSRTKDPIRLFLPSPHLPAGAWTRRSLSPVMDRSALTSCVSRTRQASVDESGSKGFARTPSVGSRASTCSFGPRSPRACRWDSLRRWRLACPSWSLISRAMPHLCGTEKLDCSCRLAARSGSQMHWRPSLLHRHSAVGYVTLGSRQRPG